MEKSKEALSDAIKEIGLEINTENTKRILTFHYQNSGENNNIEIVTK
jgi:hypothetical protein